jgi:GNAT superfamily N-acetyltransferase
MSALPGQQTLVACWRALTQVSPGARIGVADGLVTAVFPSWLPLNNAILTAPASREAADAAAADAARVFADAGVPTWALWLPSPIADLQSPGATSSVTGMVADTRTLVMTLALGGGWASHPGVSQTSIAAATLATDERVVDLPDVDGVAGLDAWVLVHEGAAVAGAWSYLHGTDIGVYTVGTVPQLRRRGLAGALMQHVLADAHRRGARTASLQSTPEGEPLYRSLGFTAVGRYEEWVPAAVGAAASG